AVTAFLSMWISNTATTAMMLPLGLGVLSQSNCEPGRSRFGTALMLGIAWAASVGGIGTIIGSPPNGIALSILNSNFSGAEWYRDIRFLDWMKIGVPYVLLFIPVVWSVLLMVFPPELKTIPGGKARLLDESSALGAWSRGEKMALAVFSVVVVLWVTRPFWETLLGPSVGGRFEWFNEYTIALFGAVLLFLVPVNWRDRLFVLDWKDSKYVDWGTLLLFGGGIALSDAMFRTGLASWMATSFVSIIGNPSTLMLVIAIVLMVVFLTEITSNTAVTSMMVPIVITIAVGTGNDPVAFSVATALTASLAFMLPVATPPNALVYGTGHISVRQMAKGGLFLDLVGWIFTVVVLYVFGDLLFGIIQF
ncbi:MAG: SLC13 family permease, partial [Bacteroidota bacterium]